MNEIQVLKDVILELKKITNDQNIEKPVSNIIFIVGELIKSDTKDNDTVMVLTTLYDSLAFDNLWQYYSVNQYKKCAKLLEKLSRKKNVTARDLEKVTDKLEKIGFFTTPYPMSEV